MILQRSRTLPCRAGLALGYELFPDEPLDDTIVHRSGRGSLSRLRKVALGRCLILGTSEGSEASLSLIYSTVHVLRKGRMVHESF